MADQKITARVDELLAELDSLTTREDRDALFQQVIDDLPPGVSKPNRVGNEAHMATPTATVAEVKRRWDADKVAWQPEP